MYRVVHLSVSQILYQKYFSAISVDQMNRGIKDYSSSSGKALRMNCQNCFSNDSVIKAGLRSTSKGKVQKYYCKDCETYFSDTKRSKTQYPEHVILYTLEQYNKGYSVSEAKKLTGKRYQYSPPSATTVRMEGRSPEHEVLSTLGSTGTETSWPS